MEKTGEKRKWRKEEEEKKTQEKMKPAVKYIGETSRSAFERNKEHHDDFKNIKAGSHILKHYMENHREIKMDELEMKMRIIKKYKNSFERQIGESIWINHNLKEGTLLLNSKNEYNRCSIPRLGLAITKEDIIDEYKESQREMEFRREINKLRDTFKYICCVVLYYRFIYF